MKKFHVIGFTGTNGSGKGTAVKEFISHYGAKHFSVSGLIEEEGIKRGIPCKDRDALRPLGNSLREKYGPDYLVRTLADRAVLQKEGSFIIESLRCPGEIAYLSRRFEMQFTLIGADAPVEVRYDRIFFNRGEIKDQVSLEEFKLQEKLESENTDRWKQNLPLCMEMVRPRFRVWNEFGLGDIRKRVKEIAHEIGLKRR